MQIGSGFSGQTEKEKKQYISLSFEKGLLALYPALKDIKLTLWYVPQDERKSEKSPQWKLSLNEAFKPKEQNNDAAFPDEIPY